MQSGQHVAWPFGGLQRKLLEAGKAESTCINMVILPEALSCALPGMEQTSQVPTDGVPDLIWPHSESGCAPGHPTEVPPTSTHRPCPGRHPGTAGEQGGPRPGASGCPVPLSSRPSLLGTREPHGFHCRASPPAK